MGKITRLKRKLKQSGVSGVVSGVLHHVAYSLDSKKLKDGADKEPANEYLGWLRLAVPGMMMQGNVDAMRFAIANMPSGKPVLEIGSFCGLSTAIMSYFLDKKSGSTTIFTCDKWEFEGQNTGEPLGDSLSVTHDAYKDYVKDIFLSSMNTFSANRLPHTIECLSDEFFRLWAANEKTVDVFERPVTLGGKISFCFIDGNHTYEYAKRDFENTDQILVSGGFILFDDSADGSDWEVNTLVREIVTDDKYELISKNPNYFFRKR
jgi:hypothetical protein